MIVALGRWVLGEACRQAGTWSGAVRDFHVSVNLSARQLQELDLVDQVTSALRAGGLPPRLLALEVTESMIMLEPESMAARLEELKALGVRIAIDDFGTGYSSLAYLQNLPVDILKIDRAFIHEATPGRGVSPLVRGIVNLGKAMKLVTVAEGIERPQEADGLRLIACDFGQGFHFGRPVDAATFGQLLSGEKPLASAVS